MTTPGDKPTWTGTCNNNEEIMILEVRGDMGGVEGRGKDKSDIDAIIPVKL